MEEAIQETQANVTDNYKHNLSMNTENSVKDIAFKVLEALGSMRFWGNKDIK